MIFGFGKKHKLPVFPPGASSLFKSLCKTISAGEAQKLAGEVKEYLIQLENQSETNDFLDIETARLLAAHSEFLLDQYGELTSDQQALVIGAVSYFAIADDPLPEDTFASGLMDDAKIMNHVLEELGILDRFIPTKGT